jgi:hypothetical protein
MGVSLLVPAFLAGLAALAVPIWIHLTNRERREVMRFPSLMFLSQIPYRTVRRQKLRNLLLFALRSAAIILLVAAFSRPFLERADLGSAAILDAREIVILVDRSFSMGYGDRWDRARAEAHRVVDGLGPEDRVTLAFFDERARSASGRTGDRAALHAAIDRGELGSGATRFAPALRLARSALEGSRLPRREVVLISDYQRRGWLDREPVQLPGGAELVVVDVAAGEPDNLAVTDVSLRREVDSGRERVIVAARVVHRGSEPPGEVEATLDIDGQTVAATSVQLDADAATLASFEPVVLPPGPSRATVRIADDRLPADNAFHFVVEPGQGVSTLIVQSDRGRSDRSLFVRRALATSHRPPINVRLVSMSDLRADELALSDLVVLNDAPLPDPARARAISDYVEAGGGLLVALGPASGADDWGLDAVELLPGSPGAVVDVNRGARLAALDHSHPAFEIFRTPRSGDFSAARFYRYRAVTPDSGASVLARFDDGGPALLEKRVGRGGVLLWTSTLDRFWNDMAVQPVFVPFLHRLARHAAGFGEQEMWYTVGQTVDLATRRELETAAGSSAADAAGQRELVAVAPGGGRTAYTLAGSDRFVPVAEQGFYELRDLDATGSPLLVFAANLDYTESDLTPLDTEELQAAVLAAPIQGAEAGAGVVSIEDRERRQSLWWYIIVVAALLLAAETLFSNRLSRAQASA